MAAVAAILLMPRGSLAQGFSPQSSFHLLPYVGVSEAYDDNLFGVPSGGTTVTSTPPPGSTAPPTTTHLDREGDFITRINPGLQGTWQKGLFSLTAGYGFASDVFAEHSEFTDGFSAQNGNLNATYEFTPNLTTSLFGSWAEGESGQAVSNIGATQPLVTGVQTGRGRTEAFSGGPTATYRINAATTIGTTYQYSTSDQIAGARSENHQGSVSLDRVLTPVDTGLLSYSISSFSNPGSTNTQQNSALQGSQPGGSLSNSITLGWTRQLSSVTTLSLQAGPRFTSGSVTANAEASLVHQLRDGRVELGYSRFQGAIVGATGTFNSDRVWLGANHQFTPDVGIWGRASYFRNSGEGPATNSESLEIGTGYALTNWLAIQASYQFLYQDNVLISDASNSGNVYTNVVQIGFYVSYPVGPRLAGPSPWTYPVWTYPGSTYPGSTYPGSTYPGSTYPGSTYPGSGVGLRTY